MKTISKNAVLVVGQRVHCILYGGMEGIIVAIEGDQTPENVRDFGGIVTGGHANFKIAFADHYSSVPEAIVRGVQWRIYDSIATPEEMLVAVGAIAKARAKAKEDQEEKARRRNARRDNLLGEFGSWLEPKPQSKKSHHALGAANIRRELRRHFPGIRFSVRSDSFSGGDSIDISWELGPTAKEVESFTDKYQEGTFDGMTDCYNYDQENVWPDVFGGAAYVNCHRSFGLAHATVEKALRQLVALREFDYSSRARRILSAHSFPAGAVVAGLDRTGETGGSIEEIYRPTFTVSTL